MTLCVAAFYGKIAKAKLESLFQDELDVIETLVENTSHRGVSTLFHPIQNLELRYRMIQHLSALGFKVVETFQDQIRIDWTLDEENNNNV